MAHHFDQKWGFLNPVHVTPALLCWLHPFTSPAVRGAFSPVSVIRWEVLTFLIWTWYCLLQRFFYLMQVYSRVPVDIKLWILKAYFKISISLIRYGSSALLFFHITKNSTKAARFGIIILFIIGILCKNCYFRCMLLNTYLNLTGF